VYDRLRLIQPLFFDRVAVERPFLIERWAFGWMTKGVIPAHAAHAWLATHTGALVLGVESVAQIVYFSHLFVVPLVIVALWILGNSREGYRTAFLQHIGALTVLNFSAIVFYLLLPVAPPWWVTLNGMARPTPGLVAEVNMAAAMNGSLVQGMIRNASGWFAAVPSLHGAYPVLLLLLSPWRRNRRTLACFAAYACAMWSATVVLNQHYIIDLLAGAFLAVTAWWVAISASFARVYKAGRSHTT
jgi:membrane-associated phospholipid phosphatase